MFKVYHWDYTVTLSHHSVYSVSLKLDCNQCKFMTDHTLYIYHITSQYCIVHLSLLYWIMINVHPRLSYDKSYSGIVYASLITKDVTYYCATDEPDRTKPCSVGVQCFLPSLYYFRVTLKKNISPRIQLFYKTIFSYCSCRKEQY